PSAPHPHPHSFPTRRSSDLLVYLDNAASAQKPRAVLDRMTQAYTSEYANVHRGLHYLANAATEAYEGGRERVTRFQNARRSEERSEEHTSELQSLRHLVCRL